MVEILGFEDLPDDHIKSQVRYIADNLPKTVKTSVVIDPMKSRISKMKKTIITGARLIQDRLCGSQGRNAMFRPCMLTLTYAKTGEWDACHIRDFLTTVRNWLGRRGHKFRYAWTAELQKRGAVHYHIVIWLPRVGSKFLKLPKVDKKGWWKHGSSNIAWAKKAVGYITKYASKGDDLPAGAKFPRGCRLYGVGGLLADDRVVLRFYRAPKFVREHFGEGADIRKVRGGYIDVVSCSFLKSPWVFWGLIGKRPFFYLQPIDN